MIGRSPQDWATARRFLHGFILGLNYDGFVSGFYKICEVSGWYEASRLSGRI
jgi:hypothetical protein